MIPAAEEVYYCHVRHYNPIYIIVLIIISQCLCSSEATMLHFLMPFSEEENEPSFLLSLPPEM